jgi:hypothetical protein
MMEIIGITPACHPRESGDPVGTFPFKSEDLFLKRKNTNWVPAFAGMTVFLFLHEAGG